MNDQSNEYNRGSPVNVVSDGAKHYTLETVYSRGALVHLTFGVGGRDTACG